VKAALGLDVGTTSVKAVVVAESGELVGAGSSGVLQMRAPRPGWAVQAATDIRTAVIDCLTATVASLPDDIDVLSLTTAAQSGSVITVDNAGVVADDLTTWMDLRAATIVEQWHRFGTSVAIRALCGWTVHPGQGLPQLAWLRQDDPAAWANIGRVGSADDLVMSWLTGMWVTNPSNAAGMALIDVADGQWSHNLCELIDLDAAWLSDLRTSGEVIGTLLPEIAERTGLDEDLTVVSGGHDQACTALALGVTDPAHALLAGGTAWVLTTVIAPEDTPEVSDEMNVSFHVVPQLRTASTYLGGMGACIEWSLSTAQRQNAASSKFVSALTDGATVYADTNLEKDRFAMLDNELNNAVSSTSPYFRPLPDDTDTSQLPGAGRFTNTTPDTSDSQRVLAIMEYAAFKLRTALVAIPQSRRPASLTVVGGVTHSPIWTQIIADICELPVIKTREGSLPAVGAAVLGGVATGIFASTNAALASLDLTSEDVQPNSQNAELYRHRYETHLEQETQP
jgi:xylulokinase